MKSIFLWSFISINSKAIGCIFVKQFCFVYFCNDKNIKNMKIEHLAIWVSDLEDMRSFYMKYFGMKSNDMYVNDKKGFRSYFLSWDGETTRLELMSQNGKADSLPNKMKGLAHFALSVGSEERVMDLTERLRSDGYEVISEPLRTGDGYFESAIGDTEGNYVELTV